MQWKSQKSTNSKTNGTRTCFIIPQTADTQNSAAIKRNTSFKINPNAKNLPSFITRKRDKSLKFKGFNSVFSPNCDNVAIFNQSIKPSLDKMLNGHTVCAFAYGHTGSGKTYTMLGYEKQNIIGMYGLTAKYLFDQLNTSQEKEKENIKDKILIEIQLCEIYQSKIFDLFSFEKQMICDIKQSDSQKDIEFVVRGPVLFNKAENKITVQPLTQIYASNADELISYINKALQLRNVGRSTVHDQSSRSHVFLSFEFVNQAIVEQKRKVIETEGESLVSNIPLTEIARLRKTHQMAKKQLNQLYQQGGSMLGGKFVCLDLAGNEYIDEALKYDRNNCNNDQNGDNNDSNVNKQQIQILNGKEIKELETINKSLLALKECIRAINNKSNHVPFRNSIITKMLKKHLLGQDSSGIMIANLSSSKSSLKKTINTLKYAQLLAMA